MMSWGAIAVITETADVVLMRSDPLGVAAVIRHRPRHTTEDAPEPRGAIGYTGIALPIAAGVF
jgi:P-type Cu2+ transporter